MERFRLEEVLRVLFISIAAPGIGITTLFVTRLPSIIKRARVPSTGGSFALAFIVFLAYGLSVPQMAFVLGLLLHLAVRPWGLSRIVLLPFFLGVAALVTWYLFRRHGENPDLQFIGVGISFIAWLFYCYGPFSLWRYRFDSTSDSDF